MNILILTQVVDSNDPVLSFFHGWIKEFSQHFDKVNVICLKKGEFNLPENVFVHSLGKEEKASRIQYVIKFYLNIWKLRKEYDVVFVHMNQEYVLLGGMIWKILGKKVSMWRNHHKGSVFTAVAAYFCDKIFCTSKYSYTAKYKKTSLMPVGIDESIFKIDEGINRATNSILFIARIAPSKRPHLLIEALGDISKRNLDFTATIVGDALSEDKDYLESLIKQVEELEISDRVSFRGGIKNIDTVNIYNAHEICVNLSSSGMYDKTIFEAALCGNLSLSANRNLIDKFPIELLFTENDLLNLTEKIENLLNKSLDEKTRLVMQEIDFIKHNHTLEQLGKSLKYQLKLLINERTNETNSIK